MPKDQIDELLNKTKAKSKVKHTLKHTFKWPLPLELKKEDLSKLMLIKGVAMSEGDVKTGEGMTRDNVIAGAGGLRASSLIGFATLDIDHYEEELPKEYTKEYPGLKVPCGFHIDAEPVENLIGEEKKKTMQVEFLAILENKKAYEMVQNHDFVGCSVVDYPRELSCKDCDEHTDGCTCSYKGSAYLKNTLVLKEVPNSNGTWVDVVTEDDIGSIIKNAEGKELEKSKLHFKRKHTVLQDKILHVLEKQQQQQQQHEYKEADLSDYMTDGIWNDGKDSIVKFLTDEKEIDEVLALDMAEYLFSNPEKLNQYQLTDLSNDDMVAWWNTVANVERQLNAITKRLATLSWLEHNAKPLRDLKKHDVPFGQEEVNFGDRPAGSQCIDCRWYSSFNFDSDDKEIGACQLVSGDIEGIKGCDRFEALPSGGGGDTGEEEEEEENPTAPAGEEEPTEEPNENMDDMPDEVEPDEDGNCPSGYTLNEDGTMCIKAEKEKEEGESEGMEPMKSDQSQSTPVPTGPTENVKHTFVNGKKIIKHGLVEKSPSEKSSAQTRRLDSEITKLNQKKKRLSLELKYTSKFNRQSNEKKTELNKTISEINRLKKLKKKS